MRRVLNFQAEEISRVFEKWNQGPLASYLVEITAHILKKKDPVNGKPLVEMILDRAGQKGTGKWTAQNALDLGVPIPTIHAAINARILSAYLEERREIAELYPTKPPFSMEKPDEFVQDLGKALYAAQILTYAQGMTLLQKADAEYNFHLSLETIARIWKGGCIIRAKLLDHIQRVYRNNPKLPNMVIDPEFKSDLAEGADALRTVVKITTDCSIPSSALSATLNYFYSFKTKNLPINLIQAQRDYFGAHTYQRIDREGSFHTLWDKE
jgi:6-phosphogluconate dehydrogenase